MPCSYHLLQLLEGRSPDTEVPGNTSLLPLGPVGSLGVLENRHEAPLPHQTQWLFNTLQGQDTELP